MKNLICTLTHLECNLSNEHDGDELYIMYKGKKIWPLESTYAKGLNETKIPMSIKLNSLERGRQVILELWDSNLLLRNNLLGEFLLVIDEIGGPFRSDLKRTDKNGRARYTLEFKTQQVLQKQKNQVS